MALNKSKTAEKEKIAPAFEEMPEDDMPDAGTAVEAEVETAKEVVAEPKTTALAAAPSRAVAAPTRKFVGALADLEGVIDPSSLEWNTFTRIVVGLDGFSNDQKKDLGKVIKLEVMSWNLRYVASPGVQDKEATEKVRYSLDGKTIQGTGESIHEYIKLLKEVDGYDKAALKEYLSIIGFLVEADGQEIPAEAREIVSLQVPPQSRALFTRYQIETGVKIAQRVLQPSNLMTCTQVKNEGKTTKFASIKFSGA